MEFKFTAATKAKLLGKFPFSVKSSIDFTPPMYDDVPEELRPVYKLRSMNKGEADCVSRALGKKTDNQDLADLMREAVRKCCIGWSNLIDLGAEELIEYHQDDKGGASKELFNSVPLVAITELFTHLTKMSGLASDPVTLTEEEKAGL